MSVFSITGKDLLDLGYPTGPVFKVLIDQFNDRYSTLSKDQGVDLLKRLLADPAGFLEDEQLSEAATLLLSAKENTTITLLKEPVPYKVYGEEYIDPKAMTQINQAVKLPVAVAGALMPDAHPGYGLPIGGVLATSQAVIPYGVGVDIGCRMCLSILDLPVESLKTSQETFVKSLNVYTKFGAGAEWRKREEHAVLARPEFKESQLLRQLFDKAAGQLGTSGSGNHFVEWGIVTISETQADLNLAPGKYVALLSHSGSRGFGAQVAGHYTRIAKELCELPEGYKHLAYLDMNTEAGQEYWTAMTLAGDYAAACHEVIHQKLIKASGATLLARVENHHNFAWKEMYEGQEVIVHRKGATPAGEGVLGIIPGSMTAPGFIVKGKGTAESLQSASHGAGRVLSRNVAKNLIKPDEMRKVLADHGVVLLGGGLDEAPAVYKDIRKVMSAQSDLVEVIGEFTPKYVRMADGGPAED